MPLQRPPGPTKRLTRSEKVLRGSGQLSKAASTPPRSRRTGSEETRRVSAVAGNSQKPPLRPLPEAAETAPEKREGFRGSRQLSKAVPTPPGEAETALEKRERFPQKPAPLKSRFNPPRSRQDSSGGASVSRHLLKAASTPPRAAETAPGKREGFPR